MSKVDRDSPLPEAMQGEWVDSENPTATLIINGGEVTCFGAKVGYDYKEIEEIDGALTVSLKIDDPSLEDAFQRDNVTELVITPEGDFLAYNVKFSSEFVRANT